MFIVQVLEGSEGRQGIPFSSRTLAYVNRPSWMVPADVRMFKTQESANRSVGQLIAGIKRESQQSKLVPNRWQQVHPNNTVYRDWNTVVRVEFFATRGKNSMAYAVIVREVKES